MATTFLIFFSCLEDKSSLWQAGSDSCTFYNNIVAYSPVAGTKATWFNAWINCQRAYKLSAHLTHQTLDISNDFVNSVLSKLIEMMVLTVF